MRNFKYVSLFSGIGGFELGIKTGAPNWSCVGYSEIDQYSLQVYRSKFDHKYLGDIKKIKTNSIQDADVIVGGFPCQSYSTAGKRKGLQDERGELFFDMLKIIERLKPKAIFLENVKGLTNHNKGTTFWYIKQRLRELGYKIFDQIINSSEQGIPHQRERVYIVGFRDNLNIDEFHFPTPCDDYLNDRLDFRKFLECKPPEYVYLTPTQVMKMKGFATHNSFCGSLSYSKYYNCITASYYIDSGNSMKFFRNNKVSALSPIECERLQGFPDNWTQEIPIRRRYKALGNAVTTNVIMEISKLINQKLLNST